MSLNIKNSVTTGLIRELADLKRVSLTAAVTIAVQSEIERERAMQCADLQLKKKSRMQLLEEYSERTAPLFHDGPSGNDLINALYDETTGLPK